MDDKWGEALDIDDSDLPSLILRPCSSISTKPNHISPALIPPRQLIPGPAAKIQSAMNRKRLHDSISDDPPIPTQDFLLKAALQQSELDDDDNDDDFKSNALLHAIHFLKSTTDVVIRTTPSNCIDNDMPDGIVNQVVAIISSCRPNGLGDMTVTLKVYSSDSSFLKNRGIIDGTIHRKVLTESEFGKDISVKATMILKKVSIFSPSSKTVYLNITKSNVVKVFRKDIAPLLGNTHVVAPRVTYHSPDISKKSRILEDAFAQEQGRTEESMHEVCQVATAGRSWILNNQKKNGLSFPASGNDETSKNTGTHNKALWAKQCSAATEIYEEAGDDHVTLDDNEKQPTSDILSEEHKKNSGFVTNTNGDNGDEVEQPDKAVKQRSISKVSVRQWTDEQLLELFDDDDPFF